MLEASDGDEDLAELAGDMDIESGLLGMLEVPAPRLLAVGHMAEDAIEIER